MGIDNALRTRVQQLIERGVQIASMRPQHADTVGRQIFNECFGWAASALTAIESVFPSPMHPYRNLANQAMLDSQSVGRVGKLTSILQTMLVDLDAGVLATVADAARVEVFDDFIDHAEHYLAGGRVAQAGVIAGVVFEDTVRKLCAKRGVGIGEAKLDALISSLEKAGFFTPVKAKRARAAADVRTRATHANWDKFEASDVEATIKVTRELIEAF